MFYKKDEWYLYIYSLCKYLLIVIIYVYIYILQEKKFGIIFTQRNNITYWSSCPIICDQIAHELKKYCAYILTIQRRVWVLSEQFKLDFLPAEYPTINCFNSIKYVLWLRHHAFLLWRNYSKKITLFLIYVFLMGKKIY